MSKTHLSMSISADGYVAGPSQSEEHPLGVGGHAVHHWHMGPAADHPVNRQVVSEMMDGMGATIMGRNMFGPVRGEWGASDWRGWWGPNPPYHHPVFVLTHHAHDPVEMEGGTTFHFVTDGIESALARATEAAGGRDIRLGGGASVVRQYLEAGLVDELHLPVVPVLLGSGERIFTGDAHQLEGYTADIVSSPAVAHVVFTRR